jgi:hypothetical protein
MMVSLGGSIMPLTANAEALNAYHPDRNSLYHPAGRSTVFGDVPSPSFACICAELSRLAYTSFDNQALALRTALGKGRFELLKVFSAGSAQAFAALGPDGETYLVFRGTEADDPTDLGTDADFRLDAHAPFPGKVHTGFARSFLQLLPDLKDHFGSPLPRLILTGHSLGAALATLAASIFPDCRLVTFGSPRVGDRDFADACAARPVDRYVDCCDLVTELPPQEIFGYVHAGAMRYIDRDGHLHTDGVTEAFVVADRVEARLDYVTHYAFKNGNVAVRDLADHAPVNYIRAFLS